MNTTYILKSHFSEVYCDTDYKKKVIVEIDRDENTKELQEASKTSISCICLIYRSTEGRYEIRSEMDNFTSVLKHYHISM